MSWTVSFFSLSTANRVCLKGRGLVTKSSDFGHVREDGDILVKHGSAVKLTNGSGKRQAIYLLVREKEGRLLFTIREMHPSRLRATGELLIDHTSGPSVSEASTKTSPSLVSSSEASSSSAPARVEQKPHEKKRRPRRKRGAGTKVSGANRIPIHADRLRNFVKSEVGTESNGPPPVVSSPAPLVLSSPPLPSEAPVLPAPPVGSSPIQGVRWADVEDEKENEPPLAGITPKEEEDEVRPSLLSFAKPKVVPDFSKIRGSRVVYLSDED
jgi:hypothetical protein